MQQYSLVENAIIQIQVAYADIKMETNTVVIPKQNVLFGKKEKRGGGGGGCEGTGKNNVSVDDLSSCNKCLHPLY